MGVRGLFTYSQHLKRRVKLHTVTGQHLGIDGHGLLYLFKDDTSGLVTYLKTLQALSGKLTIILDKRTPKEKEATLEKRREQRGAAAAKQEELEEFTHSEEFETLEEESKEKVLKEITRQARKAWRLTSAHIRWFKEVCATENLQLVWAPGEADDVLACGSDFYAVISSDSDILLLGARRLWVPRGTQLAFDEYDQEDFTRFLALDTRALRLQLAFLAGCDVQSHSIVPFSTAVSWLRFYGSLAQIHARHPEKVSKDHMNAYTALCSGVWGTSGSTVAGPGK